MADARQQERPLDDVPTGGLDIAKLSTTRRSQSGPAGSPESPWPASSDSASGYGFLVEAQQQLFTSWLRCIGSLSGELTRFVMDRLSDDMAAWSALAACKTPEEAAECQRRFAKKAAAQYAEEVAKLSQLMLSLATEGVNSCRRELRPGRRLPADEVTVRAGFVD